MKEKATWHWGKFSWDAWLADPALCCCSPAARGVWMDWLAHAHKGTPPGHVTIDGAAPTVKQLARMGRCNPRALPSIMAELEGNGVFSRTPAGIIYSRRMVRDFEAFSLAVKHGKRGGNPVLINGLDQNGVKLESESELESDIAPQAAPEKAAPSGKRGTRLPDNWQPSEADQQYADDQGLDWRRVADDFRGYWVAKTGAGATKAGEKGWSLTWQGWCRREAERRGTKRPAGPMEPGDMKRNMGSLL